MFYSEFVDDPKMKRFSIEEWGVWAGLLCLAAKSPTFGSLYIGKDLKYELTDICLALNNYDIEKLKVVLNRFLELKMIDYDESGAINIINFRERQSSEHPKMVNQRVKKYREKKRNENETDLKRKETKCNEQIRLDKIRLDKIRIDKKNITSEQSSQINELMELFKPLNPITYRKWYSNTTQRAAVNRLSEALGDKLNTAIEAAAECNGKPYAPVITTPLQLEDKLPALRAFLLKDKSNQKWHILS